MQVPARSTPADLGRLLPTSLYFAMALTACLSLSFSAAAQDAPPPAQKIAPVITTVEVRGYIKDTYQPGAATFGGFESIPLKDVPESALVVTRGVLNDQQARTLSDVAKNDASLGEDYAPVGYYQDFQIRGFPVDLATGIKINGLTIAGEQLVPLENKESVEFLHGLSGVEAGVSSAGGLINYTTKRPANVRTLIVATDQRGSVFGQLDWGAAFKHFGVRTNLGSESMRSYVQHADGWRSFGTFAADWSLTTKTHLRGDFEYQHMVQRSVAGYQLLGGTIVPTDVFPSNMLGYEPWAKPNTFDAFNSSVRLDHTINKSWSAYVTAGRSQSLIDDNIAYPYGCYYVDACNTGGAPYPWFFSPAGAYDVYDYRSPGELRIDAQFEAIVSGTVKTGFLTNHVILGTSLLRRSVALPSPVYDYVGTDNIYQPLQTFAPSPNVPGPVTLQEDSHQYGVMLEDHIVLGKIGISVAGQIVTLHDHNFSGGDQTTRTLWLPQYAVSYHPLDRLTLYGTYGVALSLGPQAPFWALNGSQFLNPYFTRQTEVGAKYEVNRKLLVSTSWFDMHAPFFYPKPVADGLEFVSEGREKHRGMEISAQGTAASWIRLTASVAAISAISQDTGTPAFDNRQIINQPRLRMTVSADLNVPHVRGLAILPGWGYTGRKAATRDDVTSVRGYNLFSAGVRYTPRGESRLTFRLNADNITNKRYWKDTGANYGDTFLHLGAPSTVRLSTKFAF